MVKKSQKNRFVKRLVVICNIDLEVWEDFINGRKGKGSSK